MDNLLQPCPQREACWPNRWTFLNLAWVTDLNLPTRPTLWVTMSYHQAHRCPTLSESLHSCCCLARWGEAAVEWQDEPWVLTKWCEKAWGVARWKVSKPHSYQLGLNLNRQSRFRRQTLKKGQVFPVHQPFSWVTGMFYRSSSSCLSR